MELAVTRRGEIKMKRFATSILTSVGFLLVMATVGLLTAPRVIAAVKAALVRDLDNPARNAVQFAFYNSGANVYHVPAGKILVIEYVSFKTVYNTPGTYALVTTVKGVTVGHYFSPNSFIGVGNATGGDWFLGTTVRIYADPGTDVTISTYASAASGDGAFSGYLIDAAL
jgi:hypothetical protein